MPVTLETVRKRQGTWIEHTPDGDLHVTYSLDLMTPDHQERVVKALPKPYTFYQFWAAMLQLVVEWDLLGSDGLPIPIDAEAFERERLPLPILQHIHARIWEDARANPMRRGT